MQEVKIKVRQWFTRLDENPVPMRTMFGKVLQETHNSYKMQLYGKPEPSSECLHCGKTLTHSVSLLYGIGPVCGGHWYKLPSGFNESMLDQYIEIIRQALGKVTWTGWIAKKAIESFEYVITTQDIQTPKKVEFIYMYGIQKIRTITDKPETIEKIRMHATEILSEMEVI